MEASIGRPDDDEARQCAELIYISGPHLFTYLYLGLAPRIYDIFTAFFKNPGTTFSKENILIEHDHNAVRGLIIAVPAADLSKFLKNELKCIMKIKGNLLAFLMTMVKMSLRARIAAHYPRLRKDELFVSNLAVFDEYRGQGTASRLMRKAEDIAAEKGLKKISLFVEIDNDRAMGLYRKCGFLEEKKAVFPAHYRAHGLSGFFKMVKRIVT